MAYQAGTEDEKAFWLRTIGKDQQEEGDLEKAQNMIKEHDIIREGLDKARFYAGQAEKTLENLPVSPVKPLLEQLLHYVIERSA